ncbi:hypothetical protein V2I01_29400 [Micromonospora sp. BRA006-A]|nr:hypothetical protein [Micromonospora sp. BRA006-A]
MSADLTRAQAKAATLIEAPPWLARFSGADAATIWTNDLSHAYVHENSAYST